MKHVLVSLLALALLVLPVAAASLDSPNEAERVQAAKDLAGNSAIPSEERISQLTTALRQEITRTGSPYMPVSHPRVYVDGEWAQSWFIMSLANVGDLATLKNKYENEADPQVKKRLAMAQAYAKDPEAGPILSQLVVNDSNPFVRFMSARALGELKYQGAIPFLAQALSDSFIREGALVPPISPPPVRGIALVRLEAAMALNKIGARTARTDWNTWVVEGPLPQPASLVEARTHSGDTLWLPVYLPDSAVPSVPPEFLSTLLEMQWNLDSEKATGTAILADRTLVFTADSPTVMVDGIEVTFKESVMTASPELVVPLDMVKVLFKGYLEFSEPQAAGSQEVEAEVAETTE